MESDAKNNLKSSDSLLCYEHVQSGFIFHFEYAFNHFNFKFAS